MSFNASKILLLSAMLALSTPLSAGLFGESQTEKEARIATHVAELLRKPNELIAQAEMAHEAGDTEEAIRLFDQALAVFLEIERSENTEGSAFSTFRIKKFHCVSMLDALALKSNAVKDVRQAVTDTSDLEARLAQEREALLEEDARQNPTLDLPTPPTWQEQLRTQERTIAEAEEACAKLNREFVALDAKREQEETQFSKAAREHSAADAAVFMAQAALAQTQTMETTNAQEKAELVAAAKASLRTAQENLAKAKDALEKARAQVEATRAQHAALEEKRTAAQQAVVDAQAGAELIRQEVLKEQAEAKRKEADEQRRLEAETLLRKQQEAAARAQALAQKQAQEATRNLNSSEARAEATANAKALAEELAWCEELWRLKKIDTLEQRIMEAAVQWPTETSFLVMLARIRLVQGRLDDALEIAATIPPTGTTGLQARMVASGVYLAKNHPLEAMKVLEAALEDNPSHPTPYFNMAVVLLRLPEVDPDRDIAARYYARSIELGGNRSAVLERRLNME